MAKKLTKLLLSLLLILRYSSAQLFSTTSIGNESPQEFRFYTPEGSPVTVEGVGRSSGSPQDLTTSSIAALFSSPSAVEPTSGYVAENRISAMEPEPSGGSPFMSLLTGQPQPMQVALQNQLQGSSLGAFYSNSQRRQDQIPTNNNNNGYYDMYAQPSTMNLQTHMPQAPALSSVFDLFAKPSTFASIIAPTQNAYSPQQSSHISQTSQFPQFTQTAVSSYPPSDSLSSGSDFSYGYSAGIGHGVGHGPEVIHHPPTFTSSGPTQVIHHPPTYTSYGGGHAPYDFEPLWRPPPPAKVIKYFKDSVNNFRFTPYSGGHGKDLRVFSTLGHTLDTTFGGAWAARKAIKKGVGTVLSSKVRLGGTLAYVSSEVLAKAIDVASAI